MVVRRVRDLGTSLESTATGAASDRIALHLTMTAHDAALFSSLTAASLHKQVALVVNGKVRSAATIEGHITEGNIQLVVDGPARLQALVTELTG
jgi:preprotein translocase subunit SecD